MKCKQKTLYGKRCLNNGFTEYKGYCGIHRPRKLTETAKKRLLSKVPMSVKAGEHIYLHLVIEVRNK